MVDRVAFSSCPRKYIALEAAMWLVANIEIPSLYSICIIFMVMNFLLNRVRDMTFR